MPGPAYCDCGCGTQVPEGHKRWVDDRHRARYNERLRPKRVRDRPPRPGNRHRDGYTKPARVWRYAGIDGESVDGRYTLLAWATDDGDDDWIENPDGLTTAECLSFLCELPKGVRYFGFAFGYDVNMMLGDLPESKVVMLYEQGAVRWRNFRIDYTPGKRLQVSHYHGRTDSGKPKADGSAVVWDMFTWQQSSFVTWLEKWSLAPAREIDRIRAMKQQRSTFATEDALAIRRYCLSECRYLAAGARQLVERIDGAGVKVNTFYSSATISKALLTRERVSEYRVDPPEEIRTAIDAAFMGGRFEVSQVGPVTGPIYQYDIRSAYPAAAVGMPCLAHGHWVHRKTAKLPVVTPWSLCKVSWKPRPGNPTPTWGPFPMRPRTGSLRWPATGTAWVWGVEVLAGLRHASVTVKDVWTFVPACSHRPFDYLHDLYRERRLRKDAGDPSEYVLKIALNATYGSLAEHPHKAQKSPPKHRCLAWAGWITAATRAQLLDYLTDDVLFMATDCLVSRTPLAVPCGTELGEWELSTYDEMFVAGTGIYYAKHDGQWEAGKTRGFPTGQLSRESLTAAWKRDGREGQVKLSRQRFIGMGTAHHRVHGFRPPEARLWRQFIAETVTKSMDMNPRREWVSDDRHDGRCRAPSNATHRATAKLDLARLKELEAKYARQLALYERMSPMPTKMDDIACRAMLATKAKIAAMLPNDDDGRARSIFADADDPSL